MTEEEHVLISAGSGSVKNSRHAFIVGDFRINYQPHMLAVQCRELFEVDIRPW